MTNPIDMAELRSLLGTILPGDPPFPSAAVLGMEALVAERLARLAGADAPDRLRHALLDLGGHLATLDEAGRLALVTRLEKERATLFEALLKAAYLTYYGRAEVEAAWRATGLDVARAPQPKGYELEPFDPVLDTPRHGRGTYLTTEQVRPVTLPEGLRP